MGWGGGMQCGGVWGGGRELRVRARVASLERALAPSLCLSVCLYLCVCAWWRVVRAGSGSGRSGGLVVVG